jgi:sugar-specific transcriptional regulator TrmB
MIDETQISIFQRLGFDEKEARAYLALLELGQATAAETAKHAGLKRAIAYHVIERLKKSGYAYDVVGKHKVKRFAASDPMRVLQNTRTALEDFRFFLPVIRALQDKGREKPRIEFLEGLDSVIATYRDYERGKNIRYFSSIERVNTIMPQEVETFVQRYEAGLVKAKAKHLLTDTPEDRKWAAKIIPFGQQIRFLPKEMKIEMDFAIVDGVLGITSFDPLFIVVIHSEKIAHSAAQLFDLAWLQGKK